MTVLDKANEACGASKISAFNSNPKRLLSKRELAAVLGVSQRTIENWMAQKRIPFIRLSPRLIRFDLERVKAALARYEVKEIGGRR